MVQDKAEISGNGCSPGTRGMFDSLSHFVIAFVVDPQWHEGKLKMIVYWLGMVFYGGHSALPLFFILSGFVLALPAVNNKPQSYPVFITRRFFRLYIPYVVALAIAILANFRWTDRFPSPPGSIKPGPGPWTSMRFCSTFLSWVRFNGRDSILPFGRLSFP